MVTITSKYIPVATDHLKVNTILDFDIFIQTSSDFVLFRKQNLSFTEETLHNLAANKVSTIFISEEDREKLDNYYHSLESNIGAKVSSEGFAAPFDNPENVEKYFKTYLNYYPIEKDNLLPGSRINFKVYKKTDLDAELYISPDKQNNLSDIVPEDVHGTQ